MEAQQRDELPARSAVAGDGEGSFFQQHILAEIIIVTWIICLWELYLTYRQRRLVQSLPTMPSVLEGLVTPDIYDKARTYHLDRNTFGIIEDLYSHILYTVVMIYYGLYYMWNWGEDLVDFFGLDKTNEIYVSAGFITVTRVLTMFFIDLPFTVYSTFVLEQKHDFNNQTPIFFIKDQILKFLVSQVLIVPLVSGMIWIIKNGGDFFFVYLWLFTAAMSLVMMVIYPDFIAPLFDKYTPLPEGELKERIEALASRLGFPLYKLYIVEGSKRSSHSNAYLYGFHKHKRIVLFDTLVAEYQRKKHEEEAEKEQAENKESNAASEEKKENKIRGCETDEIIAVLAHELGHWHYSHAIKNFLYGQVILLVNFVLFAQLLNYAPIYTAFKFTETKPVIIGLMVVTSYILAPFNKLVVWWLTCASRRFEFQADSFAVQLGYTENLKRALVKLHVDNLGYPLFDPLYSNWHHSHPPLLERLDALRKDD